MLMSVTERFREIGTMKCLGALSSFIRRVFFIEASLLGAIGSLLGSLCGALFAVGAYSLTYGGGLVLSSLSLPMLLLQALLAVVAGVGLSVVAAIYPAGVASRMVPATALRSTI
jgi:ABC-type antimicrobial peptide transport system permease subunit